MEDRRFKTLGARPVAQNTWELTLAGDVPTMRPGQFVNVSLPGFFLRRPFSVSEWTSETLTLVFKTVGKGTALMTELPAGTELSVLLPLGNGFDLDAAGERPLLAGGGAGVAPMVGLAQKLRQKCTVILGFNTSAEVFALDNLRYLGCRVLVATADGSEGIRGFVTAVLPEVPDATYLYACGPTPMLRALDEASRLPGEFSLEARMGCGFGACMGCTIRTKNGLKRVCKEGPVFKREEIEW